MSFVRLKFVDRFVDRHGRERHYFRKGRGARIVLPGQPGSEAFMLAYHAALAGQAVANQAAQGAEAGTFDRLVKDYFRESGLSTAGVVDPEGLPQRDRADGAG